MKISKLLPQSPTSDLHGISLGDKRLNERSQRLVAKKACKPGKSLPHVCGSAAELTAAYRFFGNDHIDMQALLKPHVQATAERAAACKQVLVVHDISEMVFEHQDQLEHMGHLPGSKRGFASCFSLALDHSEMGMPLGVLAASTSVPAKPVPRKTNSNASGAETEEKASWRARCWGWHVAASEKSLDEQTPQAIHVIDTAADGYRTLAMMQTMNAEFIVRMSMRQRNLAIKQHGETNFSQPMALKQALKRIEAKEERVIQLSKREAKSAPKARKAHPPRASRKARVLIGSARLRLNRPRYLNKPWIPKTLELDAVYVWEPQPPRGCKAVRWLLVTTLNSRRRDERSYVVESYRARWLVEELLLALKTGCAYRTSRLTTVPRLKNLLALCLPLASQMLQLRRLSRQMPELHAKHIFTPVQLRLLALMVKKKVDGEMRAQQLMRIVAELGGFVPAKNRKPGWLTLARGIDSLNMAERGWIAACEAGLGPQEATM